MSAALLARLLLLLVVSLVALLVAVPAAMHIHEAFSTLQSDLTVATSASVR